MCFRVVCVVNLKEVADYFPDLIIDADVEQMEMGFEAMVHMAGFDHRPQPIIYTNREDWKLHMRLMEWGIIPFDVVDEALYSQQRLNMVNARAERILDDPTSYWYKIKYRRCLIPLSGFYEHQAVAGYTHKIPYHIRLKSQKLFFLPGLYSVANLYNKKENKWEKRWTFAMVTRVANSVMQQIHNVGENKWRMPLMLPFELSKLWLDENLSLDEYRGILNYEMPSEELDYWTVYTLGGERPDGLAVNAPYVWTKMQQEMFD